MKTTFAGTFSLTLKPWGAPWPKGHQIVGVSGNAKQRRRFVREKRRAGYEVELWASQR